MSSIISAEQQTRDIRTLRISVPGNFSFRPGQYIILDLSIDSHPLSICSSPTRNGFIEVSKKIRESKFSEAFASLRSDGGVRVSGPFGSFVLDETKNAILLGGGIGITPFRSYIEYAADKQLRTRITLFYSNRSEDDIPFRKEFSAMRGSVKVVNTLTRPSPAWKGVTGRINADMIKKYSDVGDAIFYSCGPQAMVDDFSRLLKEMGISKDRIRSEQFLGY